MVIVWSDAVYKQAGKPAVRGFGGRVYFYDSQQKIVSVEGKLTIFGFDDSHRQFSGIRPDRRFVFKPEQLKQRHSETTLGDSYSVWIPWDEVGGEQKRITLIPIFHSMDGQLVRGDQTLNVLPGPQATRRLENSTSSGDGVLTASHQDAVRDSGAQRAAPVKRRPPTTIFVPEKTSQKMQAMSQAYADAQQTAGSQQAKEAVNPSSTAAQRLAGQRESPAETNVNWDGPKWNPPGQRSARYERLKSRVLRARAERLDRGRAHGQPFHEESQYPAPSTPSPASKSSAAGYSTSVSRSGR
ncbi:MAG: hypothetical protein CMJ75_18460 [Planctomycetaceae bacterium]|nr:hypothetical protein [Planctomycetaceae bacterium]